MTRKNPARRPVGYRVYGSGMPEGGVYVPGPKVPTLQQAWAARVQQMTAPELAAELRKAKARGRGKEGGRGR